MRELPYVRFLDETDLLPRLDDIPIRSLATEVRESGNQRRLDAFERQWSKYWDYVRAVGIDWRARPDNHTHTLRVGDVELSGNSRRPELLSFDLEVLKRLAQPNVELVTNSFTQPWIEHPQNPLIQAKLSELLIIESIPSYQSPAGPYHPCVEQARADNYLEDFRRWMVTTHANVQESELRDIKTEVATAIQRVQDELFLKYLSGRTQAISAGKSIVGALVDIAVPGLSTVATLADEINTYFSRRDAKWQGFIVSSRHLPGNS